MRRFDVEFKKQDVFLMNPDDIVVHEELRGRAFAPDLTALKASIKLHGQIQPVVVRKEADKPVLVLGYSRWQCIRELNAEREPGTEPMLIKATFANVNGEDAFLRNLAENLDRNEVSPVDTAVNIETLRDRFGKSDVEIAKLLGRSTSWVKDISRLLELSSALRKKVHCGVLSVSAALELTKLPQAEAEATVAALTKVSSVAGKADGKAQVKAPTARQIQQQTRRAAAPAPTVAHLKKVLKELPDKGIVATLGAWARGEVSDEDLVKALSL